MPTTVSSITLAKTKILFIILWSLYRSNIYRSQDRPHVLTSNIAKILSALDPDFNALASVCSPWDYELWRVV